MTDNGIIETFRGDIPPPSCLKSFIRHPLRNDVFPSSVVFCIFCFSFSLLILRRSCLFFLPQWSFIFFMFFVFSGVIRGSFSSYNRVKKCRTGMIQYIRKYSYGEGVKVLLYFIVVAGWRCLWWSCRWVLMRRKLIFPSSWPGWGRARRLLLLKKGSPSPGLFR